MTEAGRNPRLLISEARTNQAINQGKICFKFVFASLVSSRGFLPAAVIPYTKFISQWLMAMALAAIGAKVSFKQFKQAGAAPLLTGAFAWFCVAVSSLIIQYFF